MSTSTKGWMAKKQKKFICFTRFFSAFPSPPTPSSSSLFALSIVCAYTFECTLLQVESDVLLLCGLFSHFSFFHFFNISTKQIFLCPEMLQSISRERKVYLLRFFTRREDSRSTPSLPSKRICMGIFNTFMT